MFRRWAISVFLGTGVTLALASSEMALSSAHAINPSPLPPGPEEIVEELMEPEVAPPPAPIPAPEADFGPTDNSSNELPEIYFPYDNEPIRATSDPTNE